MFSHCSGRVFVPPTIQADVKPIMALRVQRRREDVTTIEMLKAGGATLKCRTRHSFEKPPVSGIMEQIPLRSTPSSVPHSELIAWCKTQLSLLTLLERCRLDSACPLRAKSRGSVNFFFLFFFFKAGALRSFVLPFAPLRQPRGVEKGHRWRHCQYHPHQLKTAL